MDREALENLGREELVAEARRIGVQRPEVMTRVELVDEVLRLGTPNPVERKKVRGWLGVARDLLASAVEVGLNLPDAAAMIRGDVRFEPLRPEQRPVATVTLAEIYGAQGHFDRALGMLDEVLFREADHEAALRLRARLAAERDARVARQGTDAAESAPPPYARVLPEEHRLEDDEPDHVTLIPARPDVRGLEDDEPDRVTLAPARPGPHALEDDDPDHVTLLPAPPDAHVLGDDEPDGVTLVPVPPDTDGVADDVPDGATLVPARPAYALADDSESALPTPWPPEPPLVSPADGPDLPTLPPANPVFRDDADDPPDDPTLPPSPHAVVRDTDPGDASPSLPAPSLAPAAASAPAAPLEPGIVLARVGPTSAFVYFERGNFALEGGHVAVVRVVEHRPKPGGVERVERDFLVTDPNGIVTVFDLEDGSVVRAALGRKYDGRFKPAAVAAEVSLVADAVDIGWVPRAGIDYSALVGRSHMAEQVAAG